MCLHNILKDQILCSAYAHSLLPDIGENFQYNEALKPGGLVSAVAVTAGTLLAGVAAVIPPLRYLIRKLVPKPGQGDSLSLLCIT